jgi:hypothetical protein
MMDRVTLDSEHTVPFPPTQANMHQNRIQILFPLLGPSPSQDVHKCGNAIIMIITIIILLSLLVGEVSFLQAPPKQDKAFLPVSPPVDDILQWGVVRDATPGAVRVLSVVSYQCCFYRVSYGQGCFFECVLRMGHSSSLL